MGLSLLIHPVEIEVRQLKKSGTDTDTPSGELPPKDDRFGADVEVDKSTPVVLRGQFKRYSEEALRRGMGGDIPESSGHVIFSIDDLEKAGIKLAKGDMITRVAGIAKELQITDLVPTATYGGKCYLLKALYSDKPKGK